MAGRNNWSRESRASSNHEKSTNNEGYSYDDNTPQFYVAKRDAWTEHMAQAYDRWTIIGQNFMIRQCISQYVPIKD